MKPQRYKLSQYTTKTYTELADDFELYFIIDHFKTSKENPIRDRYEVDMANINHWINKQNLGFDNIGDDKNKFKQGLWNALNKMGWGKAKIFGRWEKIVFK